jgi:hypothetical protein
MLWWRWWAAAVNPSACIKRGVTPRAAAFLCRAVLTAVDLPIRVANLFFSDRLDVKYILCAVLCCAACRCVAWVSSVLCQPRLTRAA